MAVEITVGPPVLTIHQAGSPLMTVPIALIFIFIQRYFVAGVSYAGLKG